MAPLPLSCGRRCLPHPALLSFSPSHTVRLPLLWVVHSLRAHTGKSWKRMVRKVTFVGDNFTRKPPKYERFIRPAALRFKVRRHSL
jgi:ribosomal protein S8E